MDCLMGKIRSHRPLYRPWLSVILRISEVYYGVLHKDSGNSQIYWDIWKKKKALRSPQCFHVSSPEDKEQLREEGQRIFCKIYLLRRETGKMRWAVKHLAVGMDMHGYAQLCWGNRASAIKTRDNEYPRKILNCLFGEGRLYLKDIINIQLS